MLSDQILDLTQHKITLSRRIRSLWYSIVLFSILNLSIALLLENNWNWILIPNFLFFILLIYNLKKAKISRIDSAKRIDADLKFNNHMITYVESDNQEIRELINKQVSPKLALINPKEFIHYKFNLLDLFLLMSLPLIWFAIFEIYTPKAAGHYGQSFAPMLKELPFNKQKEIAMLIGKLDSQIQVDEKIKIIDEIIEKLPEPTPTPTPTPQPEEKKEEEKQGKDDSNQNSEQKENSKEQKEQQGDSKDSDQKSDSENGKSESDKKDSKQNSGQSKDNKENSQSNQDKSDKSDQKSESGGDKSDQQNKGDKSQQSKSEEGKKDKPQDSKNNDQNNSKENPEAGKDSQGSKSENKDPNQSDPNSNDPSKKGENKSEQLKKELEKLKQQLKGDKKESKNTSPNSFGKGDNPEEKSKNEIPSPSEGAKDLSDLRNKAQFEDVKVQGQINKNADLGKEVNLGESEESSNYQREISGDNMGQQKNTEGDDIKMPLEYKDILR